MIYALNERFRQFWKEWALTICPIRRAEPGNERVKESSFKQFSKNVIHCILFKFNGRVNYLK